MVTTATESASHEFALIMGAKVFLILTLNALMDLIHLRKYVWIVANF
jgi:hypothetical protein